jgi:hypothetical protein
MLSTRPERGLLAGLLALIAFASGAVAITARGAGAAGAARPATIGAAVAGDASGTDSERVDGDENARAGRLTDRGHHR